MFPQSQDATHNLQTETTLLGPPLRRLSDKITDFKTTLHFPHLTHLKLICHLVSSRLIAILAHCVERMSRMSQLRRRRGAAMLLALCLGMATSFVGSYALRPQVLPRVNGIHQSRDEKLHVGREARWQEERRVGRGRLDEG